MSFESAKFGVSFWGEQVTVEELKGGNDSSNYDFLLIDKIRDPHGYKYYNFDIVPLKENEYIEFFGWKIKNLIMSGNNYGEHGWCEMLDYFGQNKWVRLYGQSRYEANRVEMIERTLKRAIEFTKRNYSIEYYDFIVDNDFNKRHNPINTRGFYERLGDSYFTGKEKIKRTKERLEQYNKLMGCFQDQSKRTILLRERLSTAMTEYLIQYSKLLEANSNEEVKSILDSIE